MVAQRWANNIRKVKKMSDEYWIEKLGEERFKKQKEEFHNRLRRHYDVDVSLKPDHLDRLTIHIEAGTLNFTSIIQLSYIEAKELHEKLGKILENLK